MAERQGNHQVILVGAETTYNSTTAPDPTIKLFCNFNAVEGKEEIAVPHKTTFPYDLNSEYYAGRDHPVVTLSGQLNGNMLFLLPGITGDSATPYVWEAANVAPTNKSFSIWQCFPVGSDNPGAGTAARGCTIESCTFTKNGLYVDFNAVLRAASIDREADLSTLDETKITTPAASATMSYKAPEPFLWQNLTCSLADAGYTNLESFTLTFTNEFIDDEATYQNSSVKLSDTPCFRKGTIAASTIYDSTTDAKIFDFLINNADTYVNVISFVSTAATWAFTMNCQYIEPYDLPDPGKCKFKASWNARLVGDGTTVPLSIAVS